MGRKDIKYLKISESIKLKILNKILKPGDILPSEYNLCEEYGVSRMTIRKAIEVLVNEGYIKSAPGKGTYVKEYSLNKFKVTYKLDSVIQGGFTHTKLLQASVMSPTIDLVYHLQVAPNTKIVCIRSLLFQDTEPVALDEKYIPYFPGMQIKEDSFNYRRLSDFIFEENHNFHFQDEVFVTGTYINKKLKNYFSAEDYDNRFFMVFEEKLMDEDGIPMGYGKTYILSEKCRLKGFFKV